MPRQAGDWQIRTLSTTAKRAIFAAQTGETFIVLLTLDHPDLPAPIRVCSDSQTTTSGGEDYLPFPFEISLPDENESAPSKVTLSIDNVDRQIVEAVRSISGTPITVTYSIVLASSPDTIEAGPFALSLRDVTYDAVTVEGTLQFEDILLDALPGDIYSPATFPGIFT